jgi:uncharacterized protein with PIN domain
VIPVAGPALFLDEDVSVVVARLLHMHGFAAMTARDMGRLGSSDEEQLAFATSQGYVILTHNRKDYLSLHRAWLASGRHHAGIIAAFRHPPHEVLRRLLPLLSGKPAEDFQNRFRYA